MRNKLLKLNTYKTQLVSLTLLSSFFAFFGITRNGYGFDEAFSVYVSKNLSTLMSMLWNSEANMWVYYVLLHFWMNLGTSELAVRSLSAIFAVATVLVVYHIGILIKNKSVGFIAGILMSCNMLFALYAQDARVYSMTLFLTSLSALLFLISQKTNKAKLFYVLSSSLSLYAHFYAFFMIGAQFVTVLLAKKVKKFILPFFGIALFAIPLLIAPSIHSHQVDWLTRPSLKNIAGTVAVLAGDFPPLAIIYIVLVASFLPALVKKLKDAKYNYLVASLVLPILTCFVFSLISKPIYQSVYFVGSLTPLVLLAALSIERLKKTSVKIGIITLMVILSLIRLSFWYTESAKHNFIISNNNDDFKSADDYVATNIKKGEKIIFYGYYTRVPFQVYETNTSAMLELSSGTYALGGGKKLPEPNKEILNYLNDKNVWLVLNRNTGTLFERDRQYKEIESSLLKNHTRTITKKFYGVSVEKFNTK